MPGYEFFSVTTVILGVYGKEEEEEILENEYVLFLFAGRVGYKQRNIFKIYEMVFKYFCSLKLPIVTNETDYKAF